MRLPGLSQMADVLLKQQRSATAQYTAVEAVQVSVPTFCYSQERYAVAQLMSIVRQVFLQVGPQHNTQPALDTL